jgi:DNA-binding IclR family transcriptional regulator
MADADPNRVRTTATSFRVIEALRERDGAGVTELARELDLAKGTVHKHLATLRELDYVVQDGDDYRLGLGFLGLGVAARRRLTIYRVGRGPVARLAESTDAVASLMIPEHGAGRYVYRAAADESYALPHYEGDAVSLHATAGGKAILAYLPETARDRIFERRGLPAVTDRTVTSREHLREELRSVRDIRTAYDRGEQLEDWQCVGSPIVGVDGRAVGAVSVSAPDETVPDRIQLQDVAGLVIPTATSIENKLEDR